MNWSDYFFSFQGRINRAKLWLFLLIVICIEVVYFALLSTIFGMSILTAMVAGAGHPGAALAGGASILIVVLLSCALYIAIIVAGIAVTVKRLHDRDKGAMWLLVFYVLPLVLNVCAYMLAPNWSGPESGSSGIVPMLLHLAALGVTIWAFVELYCLRGTVGDNRFGPDPLAGRA